MCEVDIAEDGTPYAVKVARTVWSRGKGGELLKTLPIAIDYIAKNYKLSRETSKRVCEYMRGLNQNNLINEYSEQNRYKMFLQEQMDEEEMTSHPSIKIEVKFFGDSLVTANRRIIKWRTSKSKEIFYYLVYIGRNGVNRDELMDMFWEDKGRDRAAALLASNVSYIRKVFRDIGIEENMIIYGNKRYFINTSYIASDFNQVEDLLNQLVLAQLEEKSYIIEQLYSLTKEDFCKDIELERFISIGQNIKESIRKAVNNTTNQLNEQNKKHAITREMKYILRNFL